MQKRREPRTEIIKYRTKEEEGNLYLNQRIVERVPSTKKPQVTITLEQTRGPKTEKPTPNNTRGTKSLGINEPNLDHRTCTQREHPPAEQEQEIAQRKNKRGLEKGRRPQRQKQ